VGPARPLLRPAQISLTDIEPIHVDVPERRRKEGRGDEADSAGLDKHTLSICVGMTKQGANPYTLAGRRIAFQAESPLAPSLCLLYHLYTRKLDFVTF
jgi:hypothetical protein